MGRWESKWESRTGKAQQSSMGRQKGRSKNPRHLVEVVELPREETRWRPNLDEAEPDTYSVEFKPRHRIVVGLEMFEGRIQDFAIVLERYEKAAWMAVARCDCAHGHVHIDQLRRNGQTIRERPLARSAGVSIGHYLGAAPPAMIRRMLRVGTLVVPRVAEERVAALHALGDRRSDGGASRTRGPRSLVGAQPRGGTGSWP
jgi:hypothetical protein